MKIYNVYSIKFTSCKILKVKRKECSGIMNVTNKIKSYSLRKVYDYLDKDPDNNIPKLMNWVDKFDRNNNFAVQRKVVGEVIENPDSNWYS